jgi:hypothetical protein
MGPPVQINPNDYLEETPESANYFEKDNTALHIVLLGALGSGKSTLGNVLLGTTEQHNMFPDNHEAKQATTKVQIKYSKENRWHVVDTPGVDTPDNLHMVDNALRHHVVSLQHGQFGKRRQRNNVTKVGVTCSTGSMRVFVLVSCTSALTMDMCPLQSCVQALGSHINKMLMVSCAPSRK